MPTLIQSHRRREIERLIIEYVQNDKHVDTTTVFNRLVRRGLVRHDSGIDFANVADVLRQAKRGRRAKRREVRR